VVSAAAAIGAEKKTYEVSISNIALSQINWSFTTATIMGDADVDEDTVLTGVSGTLTTSMTITDNTTGGTAGGTGGLGLIRLANHGTRDLSAGLVQAAGGTSTFTRASNEVRDAISDLTLTLKSPSSTAEIGTAFTTLEVLSPTLKPGPNIDKIANTINSFLSAYNNVITELNKLALGKEIKDSYKPFLGNENLKKYRETLFSTVATPVKANSQAIYITEIGSEINPDLTFAVDKDKIKSAFTLNLSRIESLFTNSSNGIAVRTNTLL